MYIIYIYIYIHSEREREMIYDDITVYTSYKCQRYLCDSKSVFRCNNQATPGSLMFSPLHRLKDTVAGCTANVHKGGG